MKVRQSRPPGSDDPFPYRSRLARAWRSVFGALPRDYLALDCETIDAIPGVPVVRQIGWCIVRNGQAVQRGTRRLAWENLLTDQRRQAYQALLARGSSRRWHADPGTEPATVLQELQRLLVSHPVLVTFNGWAFDVPVLTAEAQSFGVALTVRPTAMIDAGAIVKASRTGVLPRPGDTYKDFADRVFGRGGGRVRWSLHRTWMPETGFQLPPGEEAHDAGTDAWLTYRVMEWFRAAL